MRIPQPHYKLCDGRGFVAKESSDHRFDAVETVGDAAKGVIRRILKVLLQYDKYDPNDPVHTLPSQHFDVPSISPYKRMGTSPNQSTKKHVSPTNKSSSPLQRSSTAPSEAFAMLELSPELQPPRMRLLTSSMKKKRYIP